MVHKIKQSKPWAEQTYEERAADMMRFIDEMKALYEPSGRPKAEVVQFPAKLSEAGWSKQLVVADQDRVRQAEWLAEVGRSIAAGRRVL